MPDRRSRRRWRDASGTTGAEPPFEVAIVGAGPRGLSVLERLCANERAAPTHPEIVVHVIDPHPPGAGEVWRTGQPRQLLMNTVASQITVFTDDSVTIEGPVEPGPNLYEWARTLALLGEFDGYHEADIAEARSLGPDSYSSRVLYGHYLHACYTRIAASAPGHLRIRFHATRAVALDDAHGVPNGPQSLRLHSGERALLLDAVVLAQGHTSARPTAQESRAAGLARIHHLTYIGPGNPADIDLGIDRVEPGQPVLLRGLGLNFFDYMALLTEGRGGRYENADGRLVYRPSGEEPLLHAFSRRGVPYHSRGRNQKGASGRHHPRLLTPDAIARMRAKAPGGLRFSTDIWPLIAREVESVYYATLLERRGDGAVAEAFTERYLTAGDGEHAALLSAHAVPPGELWRWEHIDNPCAGRAFTDRNAFRAWLLNHLERDVEEAENGNVDGPLKAALDVLRDLRNEIRLAVDHGGLRGDSHRDELDGWYTPLNAYLSIGPPATRVRELIALIEAGIVEITGPGTQVRFDAPSACFVAASVDVPGPPVHARSLIEARLPVPDLRRTLDPLLTQLLDSDQATPYRVTGPGRAHHQTGGLTVTERPYHIVDSLGRPHPRRHAYGVPTESVHWATAAGIRPGVDSVTLGDSDAIARAVLSLAPALVPTGAAEPPATTGAELPGVIV
ncbi:FAD/NAD(P)-binding protein [Streptomyces sp. NPDC005953]|uniref:FAD/NAD(P)-binding protein n=1 Tax=Streptomyces sp. NPDC005953 TaxID=3156719 RepID=UPI0033F3996E